MDKMTADTKTYYIKTLGCQANVADTSTMAGMLESLGFEPYVVSPDDTKLNEHDFMLKNLPLMDLFIVNTCSVRQKSEDKVYGIGKFTKEITEAGQKLPYMVMAGCMVGSVTGARNRYKFSELQERTPWVDLYINPSQITELPDHLYKNGVLSDWAHKNYDAQKIKPKFEGGKHAFVNISYGCDNFCSFCVVPYSRGKEVSRSKNEIVNEIKHLMMRGATEFTLCGQNVNSWGLSVGEKFRIRSGSNQKLPFAGLVREVTAIEGLQKLSFISSNPFDFTEDLIDAIKNPKVSNYLHIAVQSGNNEVLRKMNRRHTVEEFIELTHKIRSAKADVEFGTDIIVGFPGETRDHFMDTVKLFDKVKFNVAYIAAYSVRKGTHAQKSFVDDIPLEEKKWRYAYLNEHWQKTKNAK